MINHLELEYVFDIFLNDTRIKYQILYLYIIIIYYGYFNIITIIILLLIIFIIVICKNIEIIGRRK